LFLNMFNLLEKKNRIITDNTSCLEKIICGIKIGILLDARLN